MWNTIKKWTWFRDIILSEQFWLGTDPKAWPHPNLSVTVVVPAWNEEACIADTIAALQVQTYDIRIIVVDDCSTDRTGDIARSMGVEVLVPPNNTGTKTQALNVAIPHVTTDLFICVDADTLLEPNAVYELVRSFGDPKVAVASGFVLAQRARNFWERGRGAEYLTSQVVVKGAQQNVNAVLVASGCFMAVRTELLHQVGGYKERTMAEDMDLTWELIELGYRVSFNTRAICRVIDPHNWYTFRKQVARWYHGFIQCIKVRRFNLWSKNPKLAIVVYGYLSVAVLGGPITMLWVLPEMVRVLGGLETIALVSFYLGVLIVPAAIEGYKMGESVWKLLRSIPDMIGTSVITYGIFVTVVFKELILGKSLTAWVKGH